MYTKLFPLLMISILATSSCNEDDDNGIRETVATENVFVLPIRQLKDGQDIADFEAKRDAYVATLEAEDGTLADREFQPFFEFTGSGLDLSRVYIGLTSFQNNEVFSQIGDATGSTPEANAFFSTFDFISFQILQPLDPDETVDFHCTSRTKLSCAASTARYASRLAS